MKDSKLVSIGESGDEQVNRWESVVPGARQLPLSTERKGLGAIVDVNLRKGEELVQELAVVLRFAAGRVARFQEEWQARYEASSLGGVSDLGHSPVRDIPLAQPSPSRIVE